MVQLNLFATKFKNIKKSALGTLFLYLYKNKHTLLQDCSLSSNLYIEFLYGKSMQCPKCGSDQIQVRDHQGAFKTVGGWLLTSAGATVGTVGGAATGASTGAAIGAVAAGPLGVIVGGTIGTFVGAIAVGITGGVLGNIAGKKAGVIVDKTLFLDLQCNNCAHHFKAAVEDAPSTNPKDPPSSEEK